MSSNPLVLALVVIDLATLGLLYWQGTLAESERRTSLELLYKNRTEVGQLLTKCR
ncbi:MAG TPA: hypothetical protein VHT52_01700 [Stellaceae bacterium]|nr:hypothetical protein [Stellaceae bacterium]